MNRRRQRGQDFVEYALALPVVLLIVMGILDLGRVVLAYSTVHNAVRDGARYGIINPGDTGGIETLVRTKSVGLDQTDLNVSVYQPDADHIRVQATYQFLLISPIAGALLGSNQWQVDSQSTMQVEG